MARPIHFPNVASPQTNELIDQVATDSPPDTHFGAAFAIIAVHPVQARSPYTRLLTPAKDDEVTSLSLQPRTNEVVVRPRQARTISAERIRKRSLSSIGWRADNLMKQTSGTPRATVERTTMIRIKSQSCE